MNRTLLDTSAYSALQKGHPQITNLISEATAIIFSPIVIGELLSGFQKGSRYEFNRKLLSDFIYREQAEVMAVDSETSERYAAIQDYLRKVGTPVAANDLWIAATAMQHGLIVITTDSDFKKIPQVVSECFEIE